MSSRGESPPTTELEQRTVPGLVGFFSDLKSILGLRALKRVGRKVLEDDCLGLAGQLAYTVPGY